LAVYNGTVPTEYSSEVREAILRLVRLRRPASVFPFVMRLLRTYEQEQLSSTTTAAVLDVLEAFLVRRALVGVEPTGLLGLFRFLWNNVNGEPTPEAVSNVILRRQTVEWPNDVRLREQIRDRALYGTSIASYILLEYDRSLNADFPHGVTPWIEHVAPQKLTSAWRETFNSDRHKAFVDTWANLVPLSSEMNAQLQQQIYAEKKAIYRQRSAFSSARRLADDYDTWTPEDVLRRAEILAEWAIARWPRPQG
jgi:hypothetical protein